MNIRFRSNQALPFLIIGVFSVAGVVYLAASRAAGSFIAAEPELGTLTNGTTTVADATASNGKSVKFVSQGVIISPQPLANATQTTIGSELFTAQSPDKPYSLAVDNTPTPTYSRYELRTGDRWINDINNFPNDDRQRAMLRGSTFWPLNQEIWFSGSVRYTTDGFRAGYSGYYTELMCFFSNNEGTETGEFKKGAIQFTIRLDNNWQPRLTLRTHGDPTGAAITTAAQSTERINIDFSPHNGQWIHVVGKVKFHWSQGAATVWINGQQAFAATGITLGYNDTKGPYFKTGIYRTGDTYTGVAEWANVEIGTASLLNRVGSPLPVPIQ